MDYYQDYPDYISNSDLGALKKALSLQMMPENIQQIYDFGNLVDSMVTEKKDAEVFVGKFSENDLYKAHLMKLAFDSDRYCKDLFNNAKAQYAFFREKFPIHHEFIDIEIKAKCKFDGIVLGKMGIDLKTTACTTLAAFIESLYHFDYDRQAAYYMDLAGIDKMVYIGISKKPNKRGKHQVFKYFIVRGDSVYQSGLRKYSELAFKYNFLMFK